MNSNADRALTGPDNIALDNFTGGGTYTSPNDARRSPTLQDYENVFGPAARDIKLDLQRAKRHSRWHLPDALKGSNPWLADRIDGLITDTTASPFTSLILPYYYIEVGSVCVVNCLPPLLHPMIETAYDFFACFRTWTRRSSGTAGRLTRGSRPACPTSRRHGATDAAPVTCCCRLSA